MGSIIISSLMSHPGSFRKQSGLWNNSGKRLFLEPHLNTRFKIRLSKKSLNVTKEFNHCHHINGLAIFIACIGLGGLVAFSVSQRIKEIGIRKTLGASVTLILIILSGDFIRLIFISMVIAIPIVWFAVNKFLENYEYRIKCDVWIFIVPCLLLLIAIATMGYQTVRAARSNPVDALKNE